MDQVDTQITDTAYDPDDELRNLLDDLETAEVSYGSDHQIDLPGELVAQQRDYEMVFVEDDDEFTLSGTETMGSLGTFLSLEGNLGFASGIVLYHALILGEPTQCYTDETVPSDPSPGRYQDLTAEWYHPAAIEQDIPEARLNNRAVDFRATGLSLDEIERYAGHWLSL